MSIMIPEKELMDGFNGSGGEAILFDKLRELPDNFYIFHSARWNEVQRKANFHGPAHRFIEWREADFVVYYPPKGLLVVEVKDGLISCTQRSGWLQTNRKTGETYNIDPIAQAQKSKFYFQDLLAKKFGQYDPICNVGVAVWFTSADRQTIQGHFPNNYYEEIVLWANDIVSPQRIEQALIKAFEFNGCNANNIVAEEKIRSVLDIIAPEFGAMPSVSTTRAAKASLFHLMTAEQEYLLDYLSEQDEAAIHGCAGTGKTCLAIKKAKQLSEQDSTLFLCFNSFLRDRLSKEHAATNLTISNLISLYQMKTGQNLDLKHLSDPERDEILTAFLYDWRNQGLNYKHIIIDEGQDFCGDHLELLHAIAQEQKGSFYVFYDRNQFCQGREYPKWLDGMECRLVLCKNCRNTKEIAITSTRPVGIALEKVRTRYDNESIAAVKPRIFFLQSKDEMLTLLADIIRAYIAEKIPKENIVVLTVNGKESSIIKEEDYILSPGIVLSTEPAANKIWFTTSRKFKGLEAEVVICVDVDADNFSVRSDKNTFYVASSRAQTFLDLISIVPSTASLPALAEAITGHSVSNSQIAKARIASSLQVRISTKPEITLDTNI